MSVPLHHRPVESVAATLLFAMCLVSTPVRGQTQRSAPPASAQAVQQVQQLAAERSALQAENARLKSEVEKMKTELQALKGAQGTLEQRSRAAQTAQARSTADVQRLEADSVRERERMQELVTRFRETANTLRDIELDRNSLRQQLVARDTELSACVDRNASLYTLNGEVLTKFEDQGFWSAMAQRESFTRIKRNQLENLVDDYRAKAADQQMPAQPSGGVER